MKMKTLLALAVSAVCAAGVAHAGEPVAKQPSIEVQVFQLDPVKGG